MTFKKARATKKQLDWDCYKKIQKEAQQAWRRAHDDYISNMVSKPSSNNKKLFVYIKDMKSDSSGVAPLKKDGINYWEPTDQIMILNEQFVSTFTKEDYTSIPGYHGKQHSNVCATSHHPGKWGEEAASWPETAQS